MYAEAYLYEDSPFDAITINPYFGADGVQPFLDPGYGAQGATAEDITVNFDSEQGGAIVNSSRGIMMAYKSEKWKDKFSEAQWAEAVSAEAIRVSEELKRQFLI